MRRQSIIFCLVLLSMFTIMAQSAIVKGRIVDMNSSDPVSDVEVYIQGSDLKVYTNSKGLFLITSAILRWENKF